MASGFVGRTIFELRSACRYTDWTAEHVVTNRQFYNFYSQLPYDSNFAAIFDCCHSGGMARKAWGLKDSDAVDIAIYAHGGLTSERDAAAKWIPALSTTTISSPSF